MGIWWREKKLLFNNNFHDQLTSPVKHIRNTTKSIGKRKNVSQDFPFKKCPKYLNSNRLLVSWIFEFPSIMSESELSSYQLQLQQVEAALTSDPANSELLKLKADLEQVIDLTKELVAQSVAKAGGHREEEEEEEEEPGWMTS